MAAKFAYARLARTAQRLIDRFGIDSLVRGYIDTPNLAQPNRPGTRTIVESTVPCVFLDIDTKLIDGIMIKTGDMRVLISPLALPANPQFTGTINRGDEVWSVVKLTELNPGGIKLLYTAQVRK